LEEGQAMSDRIDIRDGIIARIASETSYTAGFVKDFHKEVIKGDSENIVVILGNDEVDEIRVEGVKYQAITTVYIQFVVRGSAESADSNDVQTTVETIADAIYVALMRWSTIRTDLFSRVTYLDYIGFTVGEYASNQNYGGRLEFEITYDKN
jgi:hypothetical protein